MKKLCKPLLLWALIPVIGLPSLGNARPADEVCFFSEPHYGGTVSCADSAGTVTTGFAPQSISITGRFEVKITRRTPGASAGSQDSPRQSKIISMTVGNTHNIRWDQQPGANQSAAVGADIGAVEVQVRTRDADYERNSLNKLVNMMYFTEPAIDAVQDMVRVFDNTTQAKAVLGPLAEVAEFRHYMLDKADGHLNAEQRARLYQVDRTVSQACRWFKAATSRAAVRTRICNWLSDPVQTRQVKRWANNTMEAFKNVSPVTYSPGFAPEIIATATTPSAIMSRANDFDCRNRVEALGTSGLLALFDGVGQDILFNANPRAYVDSISRC